MGVASVVQKQAQQVAKVTARQMDITFHIDTDFQTVRLADQQNTAKLIKEIPTHVTPKDDAACVVNLGAVRVFNAATHGPVPDAAAGPDDAPSGVALSTVVTTDTENDGFYDQVSHQLIALQEWIRQQQAASK